MTEVSTYCSGLHLAKFGHPKQREIFLLNIYRKSLAFILLGTNWVMWSGLTNHCRLEGPLLCSVPTLLPGKRLTSPNNRNWERERLTQIILKRHYQDNRCWESKWTHASSSRSYLGLGSGFGCGPGVKSWGKIGHRRMHSSMVKPRREKKQCHRVLQTLWYVCKRREGPVWSGSGVSLCNEMF